MTGPKHIERSITSTITIKASHEQIWNNITNVEIERFSDPLIFRLLDIPKPLRAEVNFDGAGGTRTAYFNTGKKFHQRILTWKPMSEYSFTFNPEKGFTVLYIFDISDGLFRILAGKYLLDTKGEFTTLTLITNYSIDARFNALFNLPAKLILKKFQNYLLTSICKNSQ